MFGRSAARTAPRSRHVDVGELETVAFEHLREEPVGAAVEVVADDDVIAGREQVQHRRRRRHAAGEGAAVSARLRARRAAFSSATRVGLTVRL